MSFDKGIFKIKLSEPLIFYFKKAFVSFDKGLAVHCMVVM